MTGAGLYQQQLFEDSYVTLARKNHPQREGKLTLDIYSEIPHVLFSLEGKGISNIDTALAAYSLTRKIALRIPHMSVIPMVLEKTDYLATIPKQLAEHFLTRYELKMYRPPVDLKPFTVYQYWHRRQHHDPACAWLRKQIKEKLYAS
ncbi:LysR substrate-binding domain-containing protein [Vibrio sp. DNF-1]|nr:LysR substrate-binding domain-containing protein [Vibrio salinus]